MKIDFSDFEIKQCGPSDIDDILELQEETLQALDNPELLRRNTPEMLLSCLNSPNVTLGAWYKGELAAISVLYYVDSEAEDLTKELVGVEFTGLKSANYKLCIVKNDFRGNSLQYRMGKMLVERAKADGVEILCATASPKNPYSIKNIERMGFVYNKTLQKYGFERNLYYNII